MKRKLLGSLKNWKNSKGRKPLILRGARQVGKTYLLKDFGKREFSNTHYFNFENNPELHKIFTKDLNPDRILQELSFFLNSPSGKIIKINIETDLIIWDEVQLCPKALTSLKYFAEDKSSVAICAAGSLLGAIHLEEANFPVGKVNFLYLYPMSFEEFCMNLSDKRLIDFLFKWDTKVNIPEIIHSHFLTTLKHYFIVGGLPEVVKKYNEMLPHHAQAFSEVRKKQNELLKGYISDFAKYSGKEKSLNILSVFQNIGPQLAKAEQNRFFFKNIIPGKKSYKELSGPIDWLIGAGLIIKERIVNSSQFPLAAFTKENLFKLYLFDVGLLGSMLSLPPETILEYEYGQFKGVFAENFVIQELVSSFSYQNIEDEFFCWNENTAEIEFLLSLHGKIWPIEVKAGIQTKAKSLAVYSQKYSPPLVTKISMNNFNLDRDRKTLHLPLYMTYRLSDIILKLL